MKFVLEEDVFYGKIDLNKFSMLNNIEDKTIINDFNKYPYMFYTFYYKGFKCNIKRNNMGAYCGYVDLKNEETYNKLDESIVHGGITGSLGPYSVGFDCCHFSDIMPFSYIYSSHGITLNKGTFKDMQFVQNIIKNIVDSVCE